MSEPPGAPAFLWDFFAHLRTSWRFALGQEDYEALHAALRAGFGLECDEALREVCVSLWAKSDREADVIRALFARLDGPRWELPRAPAPGETATAAGAGAATDVKREPRQVPKNEAPPVTRAYRGFHVLPPVEPLAAGRQFIFVPQFPLTYRDVAQAWRRLRRPTRSGPPTELDVDATVRARSRAGIVSPPVLVPRRRNAARLLLLVDRRGSMAPYHQFVESVSGAMANAGALAEVTIAYFHDVPGESAERGIAAGLRGSVSPRLDAVLAQVPPLATGFVYDDAGCTTPRSLELLLERVSPRTVCAIISDAGAARGRFDLERLIDTVAFLKAIKSRTTGCAWLNPVPKEHWVHSTAAEVARHAPMFPLDRLGTYNAVNVLRGHPPSVERPL